MSRRVQEASRWMYRGIWSALVRWFRVPDQPPSLPVKDGDFIHSFQPAEGFLRYMKFWFWIVLAIIDIALLGGYIAAAIALWLIDLWWVAALLFPIAMVLIIVPDIIAYIAIHLRYDTTWYVMTDRSIRIRRGIWNIHETTITFENVQNLKLQRGPVQRHFGIANLVIETAGSGGGEGKHSSSVSNQGVIEGIANAQEIRERILVRMRASRTAGLGDEDAADDSRRVADQAAAWTPEHLAVLREIRDEMRLAASG